MESSTEQVADTSKAKDKNYSGIYVNHEMIYNQQNYESDIVILEKEGLDYGVTFGYNVVDEIGHIEFTKARFKMSVDDIKKNISSNKLRPKSDRVYIATYRETNSYLLNDKKTYYVFKNNPVEKKYIVYKYNLGDEDDPKENRSQIEDISDYKDAYEKMQGKLNIINDRDAHLGNPGVDVSPDDNGNTTYISGDGGHYKITRVNETTLRRINLDDSTREDIDIIEYFEFVKNPKTREAGATDKAFFASKKVAKSVRNTATSLFNRVTGKQKTTVNGGKRSRRKNKTIKKRVKKTRRRR
jgi:hypothetical protein